MSNVLQVKIKKNYPDAQLPVYGSAGAACFDLFAYIPDKTTKLVMACREGITFDTGVSIEIPEGFVMLVFSRSGHGFKASVRLVNSVGVVDSDYRGAVQIKLSKDNYTGNAESFFAVNHGDRIAQAMILPVPMVMFLEVDELSSTERGQGGFGSTGK